jgi:predicted small lipoprotein YifL
LFNEPENTMRKTILLFLIFALAACSKAGPVTLPTPSATTMETEEAAVYAAVLQSMYPDSRLVLAEKTATDPGGAENTASVLEFALKQMGEVDPQTAASFQVRNNAQYSLGPGMNIGLEYVLLTEDNMRQIFNVNQNGWDAFYADYPGAPGITTLSRVGFNDAMDQALVYIGTQSHWLAGAGYIVLLKKVNGAWVVDQKVMTWIS